MTPDRKEELRGAARLLGQFARLVELKRALEAADRQPQLNFWRLIYGGLSNLAVIEWCKLFGAEGSNAYHWKRVYRERVDEFRRELYAAVGVNRDGFDAYWREMKRWRDVDFAHYEPGAPRPPNWPHFDKALAAADHYYEWVSAELAQDEHYLLPASLTHYRAALRLELDSAAVAALGGTRDLPPSKH